MYVCVCVYVYVALVGRCSSIISIIISICLVTYSDIIFFLPPFSLTLLHEAFSPAPHVFLHVFFSFSFSPIPSPLSSCLLCVLHTESAILSRFLFLSFFLSFFCVCVCVSGRGRILYLLPFFLYSCFFTLFQVVFGGGGGGGGA